LLGRLGVPAALKWLVGKFGLRKEKVDRVRQYFNTSPVRTISLSKITLGIGVAGIYLAGSAKVPYPRFIKVCLATSALQYLFYLTIGVLFGSAYKQISHYLDMATAAIIMVAIAIVLVVFLRSKISSPTSKGV
jgi:membrane protein DedA with SNARE-associated domain